jgi:hypothetical protein
MTMHLRHLSTGLAAAMLCLSQASAATVYKWTDSNGVVHFSDQPAPGAERIITQSGPGQSRSSAGPSQARQASSAPRRNNGRAEPNDTAVDYSEFEIDSPQPEQTFTEQSVSVRVRLEPGLKPGHLISLYLNGKLVENQSPKSTQFSLTELPRGSYSLVASIMDASSGETKSTPPVTFYVQRPSILSPSSPLRPNQPPNKKP